MLKTADKTRRFIGRSACLAFGLAVLSACAPSSEFQAAPQKGAWRGGGYPSFSTKPQAETAQFSDSEKARLSQDLRSDGRQLRASAYADDKKQQAAPSAESSKKQANQEIQDTLRQITGGK